ncbi:DNA-binding transcriptional LysR family regulator [Inhella inkyongensis]|uniref:DNA-binding transcriptional LysR family regulator n=1 Tax=Inhella inkyongensis TaxID=392593 RepID=A0A840SBC2_9BURK|nr:LysR family transcriptional regulator [Inhella inkyongensis]MBB5206084.1 DNA-binding transcriptional LysR family regulator [Inhella inkyongensis]
MESIDPAQARSFLVLAEELHFGRAAERLGLRQPQLSKQLRALEAGLGTQLLERTSRRVRLSAAGQALREPLAEWLRQGQALGALVQRAARGQHGRLRVGLVSPAGFGELPRWLRRFRDRHPLVELVLREATLDVQLEALGRGELDLGLVLQPEGVETPGVRCQCVGAEPLVLALSEASAQRLGERPTLAELLRQPLVLFPREIAPALHDAVLDFYRQHGHAVQPTQRAVQMATLIHLVSADFGLAWVPASMQALQRAGVVYRPAPRGAPRCQTQLIWREPAGPVLREFLALL